MIEAIIRWSLANRFLVVLMSVILAVSGTYFMVNTPVDAIPDLSDIQVIIKTHFPGQAPQVVEDQVTYPLTAAMLSLPGASTVRGYSFFGDSYVYVIFEDGTDLYWARSRVLEYLNQVSGQLPPSVNIRYPRGSRDSVEKLKKLSLVTPSGKQIPLSAVADIRVEDGPPVIKSENARLNGWFFIDIEGVDLGSYVAAAQQVVSDQIELPARYSLNWSGQYEYMERAKERLAVVVPITLVTIILLLFLNFRNMTEVLIIMGTLPTALIGGIWLLYLLGYHMSVAVGVGFIALAGVAVEIGVVMLVYLRQALASEKRNARKEQRDLNSQDLATAVRNGALMRVRPIMMTVAAIIADLLPIMLGSGTGSEVMRRIAAPMIGGMISATILTLALIPATFLLWQRNSLSKN
jgi:Cu(I)/Ag(I) efflux system membrane protein CusA/SilA